MGELLALHKERRHKYHGSMAKNQAQKHLRKFSLPDSSEDSAWLDAPPVGREFGSPDYERLMALDHAAFVAFHSWNKVQDWLTAPNSQLDGACPEEVARSPAGFDKVMSILLSSGSRASTDLMNGIEALPGQEPDSPTGF